MHELKKIILRNLLKKLHKELEKSYPQLAVFNFDFVGRRVLTEGFFEADFIAGLENNVFTRLANRELCLDIGANIGNHSVAFSKNFKKVYAFEPNYPAFKLLQVNAMLAKNITTFSFGLSDKLQTKTAFFNPGNVGGSSVSGKRGEFSTTFHLKSLDETLSKTDIKNVSFIKIDVEGHELEVLKGARLTISKSSPIIAIEVLPDDLKNGSADSIEYLEKLGYIYLYEFKSHLMTKNYPDFIKKICNGISILFKGENLNRNMGLHRISKPLRTAEYPMLIAAKTRLVP
jgi:FkbM family methyltransferase